MDDYKKPRIDLICALARCVDNLCKGPLMDNMGAIREAIETDYRVWDYLDDDTIDILDEALGITQF